MDIRVINTRNRIQGGLIAAVRQKPLYEVKDKDIIKEAQVSSSSYYKYYSDKSHVLKDIETELINEFKDVLSNDSKNWGTINHAPNKRDVRMLIDRNINKLIDYFNDHKATLAPLISKNGDPAFVYQLIDMTTNIVKRMIIYYFRIYNQESILKEDELKLKIVSKRYALAFLGPLFIWLEDSADMPLKETKQMMKMMILDSPYDISTHGFNK